jgi:spore coat polysaccharide biosynthesis protein SpsF
MTVTAVVQARMGSTRLPGKVLMDLGGRPMLRVMLDRLRLVHELDVVVATSDLAADDAIEDCAGEAGVPVVRGSESDVLGRFVTALDAHPSSDVLRLTADCPLTDPAIVRSAIETHRRTGADYTSNTLVRTFPDGLDVEVVSAAALRAAADEATLPEEREHVTPFVYRRNSRFTQRAIRSPERLGHLRWTVDTLEDLSQVRRMVAGGGHELGWRTYLQALPTADRRLLRTGLEPAVAGEVPERITRFDDPCRQALVAVRNDRVVGWLLAEIEDGIVTVSGRVPDDLLADTRAHFAAFAATTPMITGGDLTLDALTPIGATS